jgi:hypothetical protein
MTEDKQRLLKNLEFERDLIVEMMPLYEKDEDSVNLLLDRLNEIKRLIKVIEQELNND